MLRLWAWQANSSWYLGSAILRWKSLILRKPSISTFWVRITEGNYPAFASDFPSTWPRMSTIWPWCLMIFPPPNTRHYQAKGGLTFTSSNSSQKSSVTFSTPGTGLPTCKTGSLIQSCVISRVYRGLKSRPWLSHTTYRQTYMMNSPYCSTFALLVSCLSFRHLCCTGLVTELWLKKTAESGRRWGSWVLKTPLTGLHGYSTTL